jgi:hypothetical protein
MALFRRRNDLGLDGEIAEWGRFISKPRPYFPKSDEDAPELRILKAVLLSVSLRNLHRWHDRLKPSVENIELSFKGDGTMLTLVASLMSWKRNTAFQ